MADDVRNFVEQDKALCAQALDGDRGVLIRAAEMMRDDIDELVDWQLSQAHSEEAFEWRCSKCRTTWAAFEPIRGCCPDSQLELRCHDGEFRVV